MYNLKIVSASTRPGRKGILIAEWVYGLSARSEDFNVELLDLAEINLPFLDEPEHPSLRKYTKDHTKRWSGMMDEADSLIFVTPEYNFGYPASLKNALDFLFQEWNYKPVGFVSYGGLSGGTRSVQQLKQVVTAQKMMPVAESVNIPFFTQYITEDHRFVGEERLTKSVEIMLSELLKWTKALYPLRKQA